MGVICLRLYGLIDVDVQIHIQGSIVNSHDRDQSNGLIPCMRLTSNNLQAVS